MKAKRFLLPLLGLGLAVAIAAPAVAVTEAIAVADTADTDFVTVKVENSNWLDMRVYAVIDNVAHRLGTIGSFNSAEFKLRKSWVGPSNEIQLVAAPIGSRAVNYSQTVLVVPGDYVEYRIENSLRLSFVARY